jgi:hypothetical protein
MKRSKISRLSVIALVLGMTASAFTTSSTGVVKNDGPFFYRYTSNSTAQEEIQSISNYKRNTLNCSTGIDVCGVFLSTDEGINQPPVQEEFDLVKDDLWLSEDGHSSTDPDLIKMKN